MSLCHQPACPAWGVQNLPLSYPSVPHFPPTFAVPSTVQTSFSPLPFAPSPACNSLFFKKLQALMGRRLSMVPARQECSEGCPKPAQHPKYSMGTISLPAHWVTTAAVGLPSSPEVSQVGFGKLLCRKHVFKRKSLAEAEDGAVPSG